MPGLEIKMDSRQPLSAMIHNYALVSSREAEVVFVDQCHRFAEELFQQTKAIAPNRAQIAADVKAQGWNIPRKFADGRLGRGVPAQWMGWILAKREKRRGRKSKKQKLSDDAFMRQKPTLEQMQRFVIDMRTKARLYLASGWLGALLDLGGTLKTSSGKVDRERGGADITRAPGEIAITFWNRTPGIVEMDAKHDLVGKAVATRFADLGAQISKRIDQIARAA